MARTEAGGASTPLRSAFEELSYWVELALLTLYGPAQLDDSHDPVALLRRGRREHHPNMHWAG
jgi:hypothetical protein